AGTGATKRHACAPLARENARLQRIEPPEEAVDRLDGNGVLARAGHIRGVRRGADIEREQIVRNRWTTAADHVAAGEIEVDHLILIKPRPGEPGERTSIDMCVVEAVVAGDEAGQH